MMVVVLVKFDVIYQLSLSCVVMCTHKKINAKKVRKSGESRLGAEA
jgi:hypothetical protein